MVFSIYSYPETTTTLENEHYHLLRNFSPPFGIFSFNPSLFSDHHLHLLSLSGDLLHVEYCHPPFRDSVTYNLWMWTYLGKEDPLGCNESISRWDDLELGWILNLVRNVLRGGNREMMQWSEWCIYEASKVPSELWQNKFVVLTYKMCSNVSQQTWETNTRSVTCCF